MTHSTTIHVLRARALFLFSHQKNTLARGTTNSKHCKIALQGQTEGKLSPSLTGQLPHAGLTLLSYEAQRIILKEPMPIFPGQSRCHLGPAMNANLTTFSRMRTMPIFSIASTGEAQESPPASSGHSVKHPSPSKWVGGGGWINLRTCVLHHQVPKSTGKKPVLLQNVVNVRIFLRKDVLECLVFVYFKPNQQERRFNPWNRAAKKLSVMSRC